MNQIKIAVSSIQNSITIEKAKKLAAQLQLNFISDPASAEAKEYAYLLFFNNEYLGLQNTQEDKLSPFYVDFLSNQFTFRRNQAGLHKELLAKALGKRPEQNLNIVDATAGWGRDSFMLASLGFKVTLLERSPIIHALLADAIQRAKLDSRTTAAACRLDLIHADALVWLRDKKCDIVILDPMFPKRKKSSLVKKEMVILQNLLAPSDDSADLLKLSLTCAAYRVVVKRPRLAEYLALQIPHFSLKGRSSRFDIYVPRG